MAPIPTICKGLRSGKLVEREAALRTIGQQKYQALAIEVLALFRQEQSPHLRGLCAWVLGRLRYDPSLPMLVEGLRTPDAEVREWCAWALGEFSAAQAKIALRKALGMERADKVRRAIGGALKKHAGESVRTPTSLIERQLRLPPTENPAVREIADQLERLQWPRDREKIVKLREGLAALDPFYFKTYMDWLRRKPALRAALEDPKKTYQG